MVAHYRLTDILIRETNTSPQTKGEAMADVINEAISRLCSLPQMADYHPTEFNGCLWRNVLDVAYSRGIKPVSPLYCAIPEDTPVYTFPV